jgi:hypothetical protein
MDPLTSLLVAIGANAAILAVLGFLARSLINSWLAKDLEKFKFELKSASDTAFESLKSDLQRAAFEHQVRFSKLHEKRAEVIAERIESPNQETIKRKWDNLEQAWKSVKNDIPALRQAFEQEFRTILGPDSDMKQSTQGSPKA